MIARLWALLIALFSTGLAPIDVGPTPLAEQSQAACTSCHTREGKEWHASRHGQAWSNAIFQREYRQRPLDWCVHCHAPLKDQLAEVHAGGPAPLAAEGVTCAVCHLRDGHIVAVRHRARSPHETIVDEGFGSPAFCGGCHQFNFPLVDEGRVVGYSPYPMQATVAQHAAGPYAGVPCRGCHANEGAGHRFPGAHDPAMLQKALAWSACRSGATVELTVRNVGAGHNVPTGDVHRHIVVRAWRPTAPEQLFESVLTRRFRSVEGGAKEVTSDTTIPPAGSRVIAVPLDSLGAATESLSVELRYVYTIDEFPSESQALAEPSWQTISQRSLTVAALPVCSTAR